MRSIRKREKKTNAMISRSLLLVLFFLYSCKKEKTDLSYDNRPFTDAIASSMIRVVNLAGHNQVQLNGEKLTNYLVFPVNETNPYYPPTKYFLEDGQLGTIWNVQRELLDKNGKAKIFTEYKGNKVAASPGLEFGVEEKSNEPKDYYILPDVTASTGINRVQTLPRSITEPSHPDYIKIRLVNFSSPASNFFNEENLYGKLKLTYADGTPLNAKTTNIEAGKSSEYIEIPYGTYQFRVLTEDGRIVPFVGGQQEESTDVINPATSSMVLTKDNKPSYLTYAPISSYQPGGSYSIVVSLSPFLVPVGNESVTTFQNGARIVTDVNLSENRTFARFQVVNATPAEIQANLNSGGINTEMLGFGKSSTYISIVNGKHQIVFKTKDGKTIAEYQLQASANQNYSLWIYPNPDGTAKVTEVANGMSGYYFQNMENAQDASGNRYLLRHPFKVRFLNFCSDEPSVTFTDWDGENFKSYFPFPSSAVQMLGFGQLPAESPYIWSYPHNIMVYRSDKDIVPGTWISTVPLLKSTDFINRPDLYNVRSGKPEYEPGIYTVALIGRIRSEGADRAKLIIVKHNK